MQGGLSVLVSCLELGVHRQDVAQSILRLRVTGPVEGRAAAIVCLVDVHVLDLGKVVQRAWCVTLRCNVEDISPINILEIDVCSHLICHQLDKLKIAVVSCKVKGRELFVSRRIDPVLQCLHIHVVDIVGFGVLVNKFEALGMVFEGCKGQHRVKPGFLQGCDVQLGAKLCKQYLKLAVVILRNALEDTLSISVGLVHY